MREDICLQCGSEYAPGAACCRKCGESCQQHSQPAGYPGESEQRNSGRSSPDFLECQGPAPVAKFHVGEVQQDAASQTLSSAPDAQMCIGSLIGADVSDVSDA